MQHLGYASAGCAADGVEAVEKTRAARPDVVLMDISMPNLGGWKPRHGSNSSAPPR